MFKRWDEGEEQWISGPDMRLFDGRATSVGVSIVGGSMLDCSLYGFLGSQILHESTADVHMLKNTICVRFGESGSFCASNIPGLVGVDITAEE